MSKEIKVSYHGRDIYVKEHTTYKEVGDLLKQEYDYDILLCCSNNTFVDLSEEIKRDCTVEFYDRSSEVGSRVYSRTARFILVAAVKAVLGRDARLICHHSQDKGVYCSIDNVALTSEIVKNIEHHMHNIVNRNYVFKKLTISRMDAIRYFKKHGLLDKAKSLKYIPNSYVTLYQLSGNIDYFYSQMAYSTGQIDKFSLNYISSDGFVMQLPDLMNPEVLLDYKHHSKMFDKNIECAEWGCKMGIKSAADINKIVSEGHVYKLIELSETNFNNQLLKIAEDIKKSGKRVVLVAGPSSSGKTTTATKLAIYLKCLGLNPYPISTDNYFFPLKDTPKDAAGNYDFESLSAVDVELFNRHMNQLLNGEKVKLPYYNFMNGRREYSEKEAKLFKDGVIIIEGLHALNDQLTVTIDPKEKYRIYISPMTQINIDNHTHVHTTDIRKLRRIVRDNKRRNKNAEVTLNMWSRVSEGEHKNIFPYQDNVDSVINSSLMYEIGVLKTYAEPLLYNVSEESKAYGEALRLIKFLSNFLPIPSDEIPADSVLREFIGGSSFE